MNPVVRIKISGSFVSIGVIVLLYATMCVAEDTTDKFKVFTSMGLSPNVAGDKRLKTTTERSVDRTTTLRDTKTRKAAEEVIGEPVSTADSRWRLLLDIMKNRDLRFAKKALSMGKKEDEEDGNQRITSSSKEIDTLRVIPEEKNKEELLEASKDHTSRPNYDKKRGKFKSLKNKSLNDKKRKIYQLRGSDGDKGSVKFEKKVSEPMEGNKEINWIIRIKQVVMGNFDNDEHEEEFGGNAGDKIDNLGQIAKEMRELLTSGNEFDKMNESGETINQRHLLQFGGKETIDNIDLNNEQSKERREVTESSLISSIADVEKDVPKSKDTNPFDVQTYPSLDNPSNKDEEDSDIKEAQIESIKKKLREGGISFLLDREQQNDNDDLETNSEPTGLDKNSNIDQELDEVVSRLQNVYSGYPRQKRSVDKKIIEKDYDYGINDDNSVNKDENIGDILKNGEIAKQFIAGIRATKMAKRAVQDVIGKYGVAVNDDLNGVKEYDTEIENGVKEDLLPRDRRQEQRERRQADFSHTSGYDHGSHEGRTQHEHANSGHFTGAKPSSESSGRQHSASAHSNENGKIIGVGYILFNTDGSVKEVIHADLPHTHHNFHGHHHRPCNDSKVHNPHVSGSGGGRGHPCHEGHGKHHHGGSNKFEHHVTGRTEGHTGYGSHQPHNGAAKNGHMSGDHMFQKASHDKQFFESYPHDGHHSQGNFRGYHGSDHHAPGRGDVMMETYRNDRARLSDGRSQQTAARSSGGGVQVLVILSIVLICFTVVLFVVVRNRSSHHIREMNSRTALFVPQAKY